MPLQLPIDPQNNSTISSDVVTTMKDMKEVKQINVKIRVGSVVKAKVGYMEKKTRGERIRKMRKLVVVFLHYILGKKNFMVNF